MAMTVDTSQDEMRYEHEGVPVRIIHDHDIDYADPRENQTNLGTILHWHRHYDFGEQIAGNENEAMRRGRLPLLERYLRLCRGATVVIPIGLLDHSGITIWAGGGPHWSDSAGWDSGTVGVIFDTPESREETGAPLDSIDQQLRDEIVEYDLFLRGEVYGYKVGDDDLVSDSCWGFIGLEYAKEAANEAAESLADEWRERKRIVAACMFTAESFGRN